MNVNKKIERRPVPVGARNTVQQWQNQTAQSLVVPTPFDVEPKDGDVLPGPQEDRFFEPLAKGVANAVYFLTNALPITLGLPGIRDGQFDGQTLRLSPVTSVVDVPVGSNMRGLLPITVEVGGDLSLIWDGVEKEWVVEGGAGSAGGALLTTLTSAITTTTSVLGAANVYRMTAPDTTLTISTADTTEGRTFIVRSIDASVGSPITVDTEDVTIDSVDLAAGSGSDFTASAVHNFSIGTVIVHTGFSESTYNGTFTVTATPSTTVYEISTITFVATGTGIANPAIDGAASAVLTTPYDSVTLHATLGALESIQ